MDIDLLLDALQVAYVSGTLDGTALTFLEDHHEIDADDPDDHVRTATAPGRPGRAHGGVSR